MSVSRYLLSPHPNTTEKLINTLRRDLGQKVLLVLIANSPAGQVDTIHRQREILLYRANNGMVRPSKISESDNARARSFHHFRIDTPDNIGMSEWIIKI